MTSHLPAAPWTQRADLAALVAALDPLAQGNCRYVGGAVRDTLLGAPVKDIDMATQLVPQETVARLEAAGIRTIPTGIAHGTVTALLPEGGVEITTLRRDVSTDGRHATVAFSTAWREDAARRDFTINALYADPRTLAVTDFFGGLDDLAARHVRFIGEAEQRIREDYLRILRYFRFQARFGTLPADAEAERACAALAAGMKGLSRERIGWELLTLLGLPDPAPTVRRMAELGVLAQVLPEATAAASTASSADRQRTARRAGARRPAPAGRAAARRSALGRTGGGAAAPVDRPAQAAGHGGGARRRGVRSARPRLSPGAREALDRLLLAAPPPCRSPAGMCPASRSRAARIVARGVGKGPDVARILRAVEARWIAEGFPDAARVGALLDAELG
jgi:poly(A) polymerase